MAYAILTISAVGLALMFLTDAVRDSLWPHSNAKAQLESAATAQAEKLEPSVCKISFEEFNQQVWHA